MEYRDYIGEMNNTCVAFGSFDGMHKGHMAVLEELSVNGSASGRECVAVSCYSSKENAEKKVLTTEEEKKMYMEKAGVDCFISVDTDKENLTEEAFIEQMIIGKLGAKAIVAGADSHNLECLKRAAQAAGATVIIVDTVMYKETPLTAQTIRNAFEKCEFDEITQMCGHPYTMLGEVVHGKALGRTVGMPTANLGVGSDKLMPPSGVYATMSTVDEEVYQGLTNIGTRPSVDNESHITIETFLLDFAKDIYGKKLTLEVHRYIRGVQKFDNLEEVQNQVQKDLDQVREYLNEKMPQCC